MSPEPFVSRAKQATRTRMSSTIFIIIIYKHNVLNLATTNMSPIEMQMLVTILGIFNNYQLLRTSIYVFWMKIWKVKMCGSFGFSRRNGKRMSC